MVQVKECNHKGRKHEKLSPSFRVYLPKHFHLLPGVIYFIKLNIDINLSYKNSTGNSPKFTVCRYPFHQEILQSHLIRVV